MENIENNNLKNTVFEKRIALVCFWKMLSERCQNTNVSDKISQLVGRIGKFSFKYKDSFQAEINVLTKKIFDVVKNSRYYNVKKDYIEKSLFFPNDNLFLIISPGDAYSSLPKFIHQRQIQNSAQKRNLAPMNSGYGNLAPMNQINQSPTTPVISAPPVPMTLASMVPTTFVVSAPPVPMTPASMAPTTLVISAPPVPMTLASMVPTTFVVCAPPVPMTPAPITPVVPMFDSVSKFTPVPMTPAPFSMNQENNLNSDASEETSDWFMEMALSKDLK